jgi:polysaccharide chain length determinant protein (PEP-CTERM system associated)
MLPGKIYSPEDILKILCRRRWLLLVPVALFAAVMAMYARKQPDYYRAETVILVVPQRVPESFVRTTVTSRLGDRLRTITPTIQSRTRLEKIIRDLDLYPDERRVMPMEDVVSVMQASIDVETIREDAFIVRYVGRDPRKVMEVTNRLASLYINESVTDRQRQAEGTDDFLESQLVEVKQRLEDNEKRLENYRREHALELPSQIQSNLQQVQNAQAQMQAQGELIARLQDRREAQRKALADLEESPAEASSAASGNPTTAQRLAGAEAQLNSLLARGYKPGHPDLDQATRRVRDLRRELSSEVAAASQDASSHASAESLRTRRMSELREEIADLERQITKARDEQERSRLAGEQAQKRVDNLPTRDSELTALMRDYSTTDEFYKSLLMKKEESKIASNLEQQQIGEQYKLLDAAQLPERPFSPDRPKMALTAASAGLVVGLVLAGLLEYRDRSFKTDQDVMGVLSVPVLASVPLMQSASEQRRRFWWSMLINVGCGGFVVICLAVTFRALVR